MKLHVLDHIELEKYIFEIISVEVNLAIFTHKSNVVQET